MHQDVSLNDLRPGKPGVRIVGPHGEGPDPDGWPVRIYRRSGQLRADVGGNGTDFACQHLIDMGWEFFVVAREEAGF